MARDDDSWHLDKRVPIALIATIIVQTGTIIWWAATTSARVEHLEKKVEAAAPQAERLIRVEEKLSGVQLSLGEIKALLAPRARPIAD